jgi:TolB-like protein/class 3 adenylate cyclase
MGETRKIAAILVADVVGYSLLAGADEERTLARLRALRGDPIDPTIAVHHGRVVKRTGDGILIEFRSVVDAVRCSIEVQTAMVERNAGVSPDKRIEFRVGIHLGDVVVEADGDLMGDGVNIAARLEGIAKPGAICLSEQAYWQVKGRLDLKVSDRGVTRLKNIADPIRVYSLDVGQLGGAKPPVSTTPTTDKGPPSKMRLGFAPLAAAITTLLVLVAVGVWYALGDRLTKQAQAAHLSVVVLPFTNLSGDPSQDYFADGVTENLTTELSRIRDSFVIARNTAFTYKGKSIDAKEIGKELGVRYVLEGSVQRDQNRVRVNAQLVDAETGAHLWADRFEEAVADLFKLQDEVVTRLADSLGFALAKAEAERGARSKIPDVIDLRMRGWSVLNSSFGQAPKEQRGAVDEARALFDRALQIDPDDAGSLASSAAAYLAEYFLGSGEPGTDYEAKVLGQANRAIALAPDSVGAYYPKADYLALSGRASEALGIADAGLAINPNYVPLYVPRISAELSLGRFEQAKADAERAIRLSPRDPLAGIFRVQLGGAELSLGRVDAAIDEYRKAIDFGNHEYYAYSNLAAAYAHAGKTDEAKTELAEARRRNPELTVRWMKEHTPNLPAVFDGLRKAGLAEE